jgi:hypothetical protein
MLDPSGSIWIHLDPSRPAQKHVGCKHTRNLTQQSGIHSVRSSTLQIRVHVDCGRLLGNFHLARDLRVAFGQLMKMLLHVPSVLGGQAALAVHVQKKGTVHKKHGQRIAVRRFSVDRAVDSACPICKGCYEHNYGHAEYSRNHVNWILSHASWFSGL